MRRYPFRVFLVIFLLYQLINVSTSSEQVDSNASPNASEESEGISVVGLHIHKLEGHITILIFVLIVIILKLIYHHLHHILAYIPESCILIVLGVLFGVVLKYGLPSSSQNWQLTSDLFFLILLPPIILDASFTITNRSFGANLGIILIFAVLGTVLNFLIIGFALFGLQVGGVMYFSDLTLKRSLLYSSLIVAVDPVAVLAIFEDLGVNSDLYYTVFGESLLNDAVTIVLYQIMEAFSKTDDITAGNIAVGVAKFFTVSLGALSIGLIMGVICCQITRFTKSCSLYEPIIILLMAYLSYILGDLFEWSGIISMIGCGCIQAGYAFHNISNKSVLVIRRVVKMAAHISEAIIFLYLGIETMISQFIWHTGFFLWSIALCLVARLLVVLVLCFFINISGAHRSKVNFIEQFVISYGGLRGAVAYSLAALISAEYVGGDEVRSIFISSTLFTIFFTVGAMGITMKPLAKLFNVKLLKQKGLSLTSEMNETVIGHLTAGIEEITGMKGENYMRDLLLRWDDKYFRKALLRYPETHDEKLIHTYEKISLALHQATVNPGDSNHYLNKLGGAYKKMSHTNLHITPSALEFPKEEDHTDLHSLPILPVDGDHHVGVRRRRLSTRTDADIQSVFQRTRGSSISEASGQKSIRTGHGSFSDRFHDMIDRRKGNLIHSRKISKHLPRLFSKNKLNISDGDYHHGHHNGSSLYHSAIQEVDRESSVSLHKVSVHQGPDYDEVDHSESSQNDIHNIGEDERRSASTKGKVKFEVPMNDDDKIDTRL